LASELSTPITIHPEFTAAMAKGRPTYPCPIMAKILSLGALTT
jgi:hypothetical protein